jgi:hypothetical protein
VGRWPHRPWSGTRFCAMPVVHLWRRKNRKTGGVTPRPEVVVLIGDRGEGEALVTNVGPTFVTRGRFGVAEVRMRSQNTPRCAVLEE